MTIIVYSNYAIQESDLLEIIELIMSDPSQLTGDPYIKPEHQRM